MTKVSFFRLLDRDSLLLPVISKLVAQAMGSRLDVLLLARDQSQAAWLHREVATTSHCRGPSPLPEASAILSCCWQPEPAHHQGLLINLQRETPDWFSRFDYLAEFVWEEPQLVASKRLSYRVFRHRGYPLNYHELSDGNDIHHVSLRQPGTEY